MSDAAAVGPLPSPSTRQMLSRRQAATVDSLLDAVLEVLREGGFEAITIRGVAARAGVTHTTAYTYFTSKEHLVAELSWRILRELPPPVYDPDVSLAERLTEVLRQTSEMFAVEPALAEALLAALVAGDLETRRVRTSIGEELARRIAIAVGPDADPRIRDGALLLYSGAMLQAGLGYLSVRGRGRADRRHRRTVPGQLVAVSRRRGAAAGGATASPGSAVMRPWSVIAGTGFDDRFEIGQCSLQMSSHLSEPVISELAPRQLFSAKTAEKVEALVVAAIEELRIHGFDGVTVRTVARRAGVAPATAYTYFASKEHLVTEAFARRLQELPPPSHDARRSVVESVAEALDELCEFVAAEPALAQACTVAMLSSDPDVARLRTLIGTHMHDRLAIAAGEGADAGALAAIDLMVAGALVYAGMGHLRYGDLGSVLSDAASRVLDGEVR